MTGAALEFIPVLVVPVLVVRCWQLFRDMTR